MGYATADAARRTIARLKAARPGERERETRWYRCPLCYEFHTTHQRPTKRDKRARRRWGSLE